MQNSSIPAYTDAPTMASTPAVRYTSGVESDDRLFCIRCGNPETSTLRLFNYSYIPAAAYLGFLLGPLIGILLIAVLSVRYNLHVPFCTLCWKRYRCDGILAGLALVGILAGLIVGLVLMLSFDSGYVFWGPPVISVGIMIWAAIRKHRSMPRVKSSDRMRIIIESPAYGEVEFSNVAVPKFANRPS